MNDPTTFQIPAEFLNQSQQSHPETNPKTEVAAPESQAFAPIEQLATEIGYLGDWVVRARNEKLSGSTGEFGLTALWRKFGGYQETEKSLMRKEARVSSELFADKQSNIFFHDKLGDGHGEWVINKYDASTGNFVTFRYEVTPRSAEQSGGILIKEPDKLHREAEMEEAQRLHKITSRYYELITARLYQSN